MFDDTTKKIGAGAMAGMVTIFIGLPSEHGVCVDPHVFCAPPPVDSGDEPAHDGPRPLRARPIVSASLGTNMNDAREVTDRKVEALTEAELERVAGGFASGEHSSIGSSGCGERYYRYYSPTSNYYNRC